MLRVNRRVWDLEKSFERCFDFDSTVRKCSVPVGQLGGICAVEDNDMQITA